MPFSSRSIATAALAVALPLVAAQTSTSCNPTEQSCASDVGLDSSTFATDFTTGSGNSSWSAAEGTTLTYGSDGAEFVISTSGQAPTISTDFYIFFGRVEVTMKAATGTGIVSSIVLESDDLDEIDWEFLGGNTAQVETNFFGKGNTTLYDRAIYYSVATPQSEFHTYTVDWNAERLEYIIDGTTVRTLEYDDPLTNGGTNYPQTPMRVKLGNWSGGGPGEPEGTVEWAGGACDYSDGPFTMYVQSVSITNYNPGSSYSYSGLTGSWESIEIVNGTATGSASMPSATGSASGSAATTAPTASISVAPVVNSKAVVSSTLVGASYSTDSASVSAANSGTTAAAASPTASVSTQPTVVGASSTASASASASTGNTTTSGASLHQMMALAPLLSVALGVLLL